MGVGRFLVERGAARSVPSKPVDGWKDGWMDGRCERRPRSCFVVKMDVCLSICLSAPLCVCVWTPLAAVGGTSAGDTS
jgi:hypothetical protein